jgi:large subunit ribosomal protein L6
VRFRPPEGVLVEVADPTHFAITGNSKEQVGQVAADLRRLRPPEPYKGKGVMYRGERIRRKPGKSGKGAK